MSNVTEKFAAMQKTQLDSLSRFSSAALEGVERLFKLQMEAARSTFDAQVQNVKSLAEVKDPKDLAAVQAKVLENTLENSVSYSRLMYEALSQTQSEFAQLVEEGFASTNRELVGSLDKMAKDVPGADAMVSTVKASLAATANALDSLSRTTKQVSSLADAGLRAAANVATSAVKSSAKKAAAQ